MKLYYLFDPHCGWCYAFDAVIKQVSLILKGQVEVEAVSGGMITGQREGPIGPMSAFILQTVPSIEQHTGIKFGQPYLDMVREGSRFQSSINPSRALEAFKQLAPGRSVEFANDMQHVQFAEGKDFNADETYLDLVSAYGIDADAYKEALNSEATNKAVMAGFALCQEMGATGFPMVMGEKKGTYYIISRGYLNYDMFAQYLNTFLRYSGEAPPEVKL